MCICEPVEYWRGSPCHFTDLLGFTFIFAGVQNLRCYLTVIHLNKHTRKLFKRVFSVYSSFYLIVFHSDMHAHSKQFRGYSCVCVSQLPRNSQMLVIPGEDCEVLAAVIWQKCSHQPCVWERARPAPPRGRHVESRDAEAGGPFDSRRNAIQTVWQRERVRTDIVYWNYRTFQEHLFILKDYN